jgi:RecJ-like exonuclease
METGVPDMTKQDMQDAITDLLEVRREITRVNQAAGVTVFNPAATEAVVALIERML